jgi:hypothetical protein
LSEEQKPPDTARDQLIKSFVARFVKHLREEPKDIPLAMIFFPVELRAEGVEFDPANDGSVIWFDLPQDMRISILRTFLEEELASTSGGSEPPL